MTAQESIKAYVAQLCISIGTTEEKIYNAENKAWYFVRGSANIEVFLTSYTTKDNLIRTFIRCFCPLINIPADSAKKLDLYTGALEANTQYMGVKLTTIANKNIMYAVAERDIQGMDYQEFVTLISDVGYWADELDDFLKQNFPG